MCRAVPSAHGSLSTENRHSRANRGIMRKTRHRVSRVPLSNVQHPRSRPERTPARPAETPPSRNPVPPDPRPRAGTPGDNVVIAPLRGGRGGAGGQEHAPAIFLSRRSARHRSVRRGVLRFRSEEGVFPARPRPSGGGRGNQHHAKGLTPEERTERVRGDAVEEPEAPPRDGDAREDEGHAKGPDLADAAGAASVVDPGSRSSDQSPDRLLIQHLGFLGSRPDTPGGSLSV